MTVKRKSKKLRPYPSQSPCPCDSGLPYERCCQSKAFKFQLDSQNNVIRSVPIPPKLIAELKEQEKEFRAHFGRKPGRGDKVFFQQFEGHPDNYYREELKEAALAAGIPRATVYATWKTGLIPTQEHLDRFTELELDEFEAAAEEYEELSRRGIDPFDEGPRLTKRQQQKFAELLTLVSKSPLILASIIDRGATRRLEIVDFFQMLFASQALHFVRRFCSALKLKEFDGSLDVVDRFMRLSFALDI